MNFLKGAAMQTRVLCPSVTHQRVAYRSSHRGGIFYYFFVLIKVKNILFRVTYIKQMFN